MRAEYKRDMNHNFLVLHGEGELDTGSYQVRMLVANVIPSLLKCRFHGVDGKTLFYYEITSKQSIATLYEQKLLNAEDLQLIFGSFVQVMEQMTEYLLNPEQILLQPEYIYMDVEKKELYFCYLPGEKRELKKQFQVLTEYVLPKVNHSDEGAVMLGYGVYRRALEDSFHLEHIKEELFQRREDQMELSGIQKSIKQQENQTFYAKQNLEKKENSEADGLEELFRESVTEKSKDEEKRIKKFFHKEKSTQKNRQGKLYILVPLIGTFLIMMILAANMVGLLPWLEVEILLLTVVLLSMFIAITGYFVGKNAKKKEQEIQDLRWKKKVIPQEIEKTNTEENLQNNLSINDIKTSEDMKSKIKKPAFDRGEDYGETVVLCDNTVRGPASLVSKEPGELATIFLQEDLTVIGKLEQAADAVIPLPTISRLHAKIRKKDGEYYLADLNSRNGTSVNGKMLKTDEEYLLQEEDEVDFAQARYIFLK